MYLIIFAIFCDIKANIMNDYAWFLYKTLFSILLNI